MYAHERAYHSALSWWQQLFSPAPKEASVPPSLPASQPAALPAAAATVETLSAANQINSDTVKEDASPKEDAPAKDGEEPEKVKPPAPWSAGG